jgi:eukaryotic-like serine/threonine-protein kinase
MQCGQCGEQIEEAAHFCGQCGTPVEAAPKSPKSLVGQTIAGRYRLLRQVGEGGMGKVYEAEQSLGSSQRAVAVKMLRPEWSHDPSVKARFHREAETVARLEHFNTVRIYDFGETEDGTLFIVMEYLHGRSLQSVLDEHGAMPPERVQHIVNQAAASLDEAHRLGIVHRDLKPDNILLIENYASQRDVVKLVDFGIAKGQASIGTSTTKLTELGAFVGTPAYMSPEQFIGGGTSPQSDIYSLGVTTYQMLAGRLPFDAETAVQWAQAHMSAQPRPLEAEHGAGEIPDVMRRAVTRALSKDTGHRQPTALQFAKELAGASVSDAPSRDESSRSVQRFPDAPSIEAAPRSSEPAPVRVAQGPVAEEPVAGPPAAASGGMKTAPMTQLPDLSVFVAAARGGVSTQPMAESREARYEPAQAMPRTPAGPPPSERKRVLTLGVVLAAVFIPLAAVGGVLLFFNLRGQGVLPWQNTPDVVPPPLFTSTPDKETPEPAVKSPEPAPSAPERPTISPPRANPTPRPPAPRPPAPAAPAPNPAPAPGAAPIPLPALPPGVSLPPGMQLPGSGGATGTGGATGSGGATASGGAAGQPQPAPGAIPPPPSLPWQLPTSGACQRCATALDGGGNYSVVTAIGENLLCEDRVAREQCEARIIEQAPIVAERAARAGDCAAALATVAAAMNVRISPDRFSQVNALCLR